MKSEPLHCGCCCCLSVFVLRVCVSVHVQSPCTECHKSSRLFPQSYRCLFSYCEKPIAPAFFACHSLTKIYRCVYPINTSSHYVNWPQSTAVMVLTGSHSLMLVFFIYLLLLCLYPSVFCVILLFCMSHCGVSILLSYIHTREW